MFGYVRPSDDRLTPADRETFRAAYCGLCHALGARYGLVGRMILNYDLTFLAMVLSDGAGEMCAKRCAVHPMRRRCCVAGDPALDAAAEYRFIRTVSVYGTAVLPLLEVLDWDGDKAWRKRLMAAVRTQAAFYPHFLEPRLAPGEELTPTELQILHLLCADKSNAEIAQIMDVKLSTVKTHVSHILDKLDVKRRAEAKAAAKKLRLIPDDL